MTNTVDLKTMSVVELKALVYDLANQRDQFNQNIQFINNEINNRVNVQKPAEEIKKSVMTKEVPNNRLAEKK